MRYRPALVLLAGLACGRIGFDSQSALDAPAGGSGDASSCGAFLCLDPAFGSGGVAVVDVAQVDNTAFGSRGIAERPDGRLVVVGKAKGDALVVGLSESGARDPNFGSAGVLTFDAAGSDDEANAVVVMPDGELAIAGSTDANGAELVARVGSAGLDPAWGTGGLQRAVPPSGSGAFNGLDVDSSERVIVGGQGFVFGSYDLSAGRLTTTGSFDATFRGSVEYISLHAGDEFGELACEGPGGTHYLVGQTFVAPFFQGAIVRLDADGNFDPAFNGSGNTSVSFGSADTRFYDLALDASSQPVVAGSVDDDLLVARFTAAGALDTSFGNAGPERVDLGANETLYAVAVLPDGRIVAGGTSTGGAVLAVFNAFGGLLATQPVPVPAPGRVARMLVEHAGRLLVFGHTTGDGTDLFVARYLVR